MKKTNVAKKDSSVSLYQTIRNGAQGEKSGGGD